MNWREETRKHDRKKPNFKGFVPPPPRDLVVGNITLARFYDDLSAQRKEWAEANGAEYIEDGHGSIWLREEDEVLWTVTRP